MLGNIGAVVITTHSMYDLGREAVERWRMREEILFRRSINQTNILTNQTFQLHLNEKLNIFLNTVNSSSGLIAANQGNNLIVVATINSLPLESQIPLPIPFNEDIYQIQIPELARNSVAFEGRQPVALVGVGLSNTKIEYSAGELELLDEFTEQIGTLISINNLRKNALQPAFDRFVENLTLPPDTDWTKLVENGLRHYGDYLALAHSPLAGWVGAKGKSHVERGKKIQIVLHEAIQSMKPEGERPPEPLHVNGTTMLF
ncbi:MAG: hypothetical protein HC797_10020 [Anaerolineales bacterium]|nr:hypothetical protein [Anaerolineales bacterium]